MKHKGSISQLYQTRDRQIIPELFRSAKGLAEYPTTVSRLCHIAATLPVDRYYITDDAALEYVRKRNFYGIRKRYSNEYKQKLFDSLYQEVVGMMRQPHYKDTELTHIVIDALMRPAPCVGIAPIGIFKILLRHKERKHHGKV